MGMDLRVGQEFDVWAAKKGRFNWIPMQVGMSKLYVSSDFVYLYFGVLFGGIKFPVAESQMEITGNPWPRRSVQMRSVAHTILLSRINSSGIRRPLPPTAGSVGRSATSDQSGARPSTA